MRKNLKLGKLRNTFTAINAVSAIRKIYNMSYAIPIHDTFKCSLSDSDIDTKVSRHTYRRYMYLDTAHTIQSIRPSYRYSLCD